LKNCSGGGGNILDSGLLHLSQVNKTRDKEHAARQINGVSQDRKDGASARRIELWASLVNVVCRTHEERTKREDLDSYERRGDLLG